MSDLISREKVFEVLTECYHHRTDVQHETLREALNRVPSAIVHCKDCDRVKVVSDGYRCSLTNVYVHPDGMGFCSNGQSNNFLARDKNVGVKLL